MYNFFALIAFLAHLPSFKGPLAPFFVLQLEELALFFSKMIFISHATSA